MVHFFDSPDQLSPQDKKEIAFLIHEGFRDMFAPAFKYLKEEEKVPLVTEMLTFNKGFYYKDEKGLWGTGVLLETGTVYCQVPFKALWKLRLLRFLVLRRIFRHKTKKGVLHLEMFAVNPHTRGQGIGSQMMNALVDYGRSQGFHTLNLGVVNTNPRAKKLYERLGYKVVKSGKSNWIARRAGFTAYDVMEYELS